jgi:hypothetical protein
MTKLLPIVTIIAILTSFLSIGNANISYAADHYVAASGSASWTNSMNISTPCSLVTAFANASAGDTVYLRGGTYTISSLLKTNKSGSAGTGNAITIKAYMAETPVISGNGMIGLVFVERPYWIFDGLTFQISNMTSSSTGMLSIGYDYAANNTTVQNCRFKLISSVGHDNISCIRLQANRSNYALIKNNYFQGQGLANTGTRFNHGVQYLGGGNIGTKILHNEFYGCWSAIRPKHANADTSSTGAEVAYNYINGCGYGIYGNPVYINIHNNIIVTSGTSTGIDMGDNGGGSQGRHNTINHNTIYGDSGIHFWSPSEGPIRDNLIKNNIIAYRKTETTNGDTEALNSWNNNLYKNDSAVGTSDIGYESAIYVGGTSPQNISGFALKTGSPGRLKASDGLDIGANVTQVGIKDGDAGDDGTLLGNTSGVEDETTIDAPENLRTIQ